MKRRTMDPSDGKNWALVCSLCAAEFGNAETIDLADGHYQQEHPVDPIQFTIVWRGIGPPPKARNQTGRRR